MEKRPFDRIVGGNEQNKADAHVELQRSINERHEIFEKYEVEKTPEEVELIEKVSALVDKIVRRYGGKMPPLSLDHIYIVQPGCVSKVTKVPNSKGYQAPLRSNIVVERQESKLIFCAIFAHELFHQISYKSARIALAEDGDGMLGLYRSGMVMVDTKDPIEKPGDEKRYFSLLEEAIVAECTKRFVDELNKDPMFAEDSKAVQMFRDWFVGYYSNFKNKSLMVSEFQDQLRYISNPQEMVQKVLDHSPDEKARQSYAIALMDKLYDDKNVHMAESYTERKMLYKLLDMLIEGSNGRYKNREEIFAEFARANFSGHYLAVARIVEGILGKGSFRKLAEEFSLEPQE